MAYKTNTRKILGTQDQHADAAKTRVLLNKASTPVAVVDHGSLNGLSDDDHGAIYPNFGAVETITGLWTFDRGGNPPLAVGGSSTKVDYFDADKLDGLHANELAGSGLGWSGSAIDINAGNGLVVASDNLNVNPGDGIDIVSDAVAVDVTDIIDTAYGLQEASNNIQINQGNGLDFSAGVLILGLPSNLTGDTTNATTTDSHTHSISTGTATTLTPEEGNAEGSSPALARSDHTHNLPCAAPLNSIQWNTINSEGTANSFARSDHLHAITASSNPGQATSLLRTSNAELDGGRDGELHISMDFSAGRNAQVGGWALYVDESESAVYVNPYAHNIPPSIRGALTVSPADGSQKGLVIQGQEGQASWARLLTIYDYTGNDLIIVTNLGDLESGNPGFVSGLQGWQISHDGDAEFNNAWIRGELHASVFVADEMHALGGTFTALTAVTVAKPYSFGDNIIPAESSSFTLVLNRSYNTGLHYGTVGDVIRIKFWTGSIERYMSEQSAKHGHYADHISLDDDLLVVNSTKHAHIADGAISASDTFSIYDIFLEITAISDNDDRNLYENNPGTADYTVTYHNNTPDGWPDAEGVQIPAGTSGVIWGATDGATDAYTGGLLFTSDLQYAPYIDIFTVNADGSPAPWQAGAVLSRARLGNLAGVLGLGDDEWGLAVSSDLSNSALPYVILSDQQLTLKGVAQSWLDNSGNVRGQVNPNASGTSDLFWFGVSSSDKRIQFTANGASVYFTNTTIHLKSGSSNYFAACGVDGYTFGSYTLYTGDVVIGQPSYAHMFYDASAQEIYFKDSTDVELTFKPDYGLFAGDYTLLSAGGLMFAGGTYQAGLTWYTNATFTTELFRMYHYTTDTFAFASGSGTDDFFFVKDNDHVCFSQYPVCFYNGIGDMDASTGYNFDVWGAALFQSATRFDSWVTIGTRTREGTNNLTVSGSASASGRISALGAGDGTNAFTAVSASSNVQSIMDAEGGNYVAAHACRNNLNDYIAVYQFGSTYAAGTYFGQSRLGKSVILANGAALLMGVYSNHGMYIGTNNTEAMRIDTNQSVAIWGAAHSSSYALTVNGPTMTKHQTFIVYAPSTESACVYLYSHADGDNADRFRMCGEYVTNKLQFQTYITGAWGAMLELDADNYSSPTGSTDMAIFRSNTSSHVAFFANYYTNNAADGIGIQTGPAEASQSSLNYINFYDSGTNWIGAVRSTGGTLSFVENSDQRFKENIVDIPSVSDNFMKIKVREYNKIGGDVRTIGFVAQELKEAFPALVDESPRGNGTLATRKTDLIPYMVKMIQEQQEEIDELKARLEHVQ